MHLRIAISTKYEDHFSMRWCQRCVLTCRRGAVISDEFSSFPAHAQIPRNYFCEGRNARASNEVPKFACLRFGEPPNLPSGPGRDFEGLVYALNFDFQASCRQRKWRLRRLDPVKDTFEVERWCLLSLLKWIRDNSGCDGVLELISF